MFDNQIWYNSVMNDYEYRRSEKRVVHACHYHVVWCPTFRRPVLTKPMRIRMKELIRETCQDNEIGILQMDIGSNYVYLHVDMPVFLPVNTMVRRMKKHTAKVLCSEFPSLLSRLPSLWTLHYFVSTEEEIPEDEIRIWVKTQPKYLVKKNKRVEDTTYGDSLGNSEKELGGNACLLSGAGS